MRKRKIRKKVRDGKGDTETSRSKWAERRRRRRRMKTGRKDWSRRQGRRKRRRVGEAERQGEAMEGTSRKP